MTKQDVQDNLERVQHVDNLINGGLYTITRYGITAEPRLYTYNKSSRRFFLLGLEDRLYNSNFREIPLDDIIDNDKIHVFEGIILNDVIITGCFTSGLMAYVTVKHKAYSEVVELEPSLTPDSCSKDVFKAIADSTLAYYQEMLDKAPEITILGDITDNECDFKIGTLYIDEESTPEECTKTHQEVIASYNNIMSETAEISRTINQNAKLEDIQGIQESFIKTRDKLMEYSKSNLRSSNKFISSLQSLPWVGKAIDKTRETINNTKSVQDNIDALFISMHKQYEKLVEIGTGLQKAKAKQESQLVRLEDIIVTSDKILAKYGNQVNIPISILSDNNQIKASYERIKRRILKTEAAIMGTQASIVTLGKTLPSDKAEMTEELSLNGLLDSLSDYQGMYSAIGEFLNEVVTATSEKTYQVVENLMDMQINDTKSLEYLEKDTVQSRKFALMLTDKANKLADKSRKDALFIESVAKGSSILEARKTIQSLGYSPEITTK